jgi:hypothetical protein
VKDELLADVRTLLRESPAKPASAKPAGKDCKTAMATLDILD